MQARIMTAENQRWLEFIEELEGPNGCNFREANTPLGCAWDCDAKTLTKTRAILVNMGGVDVDASLAYFKSEGCFCDCEIILNLEKFEGSEEEGSDELEDISSL